MQFSLATVAAVAGLLSAAEAHMLLAKPKPFSGPNANDKAPLDASGSNFPCKLPAGSTAQLKDDAAKASPDNVFPVGGTATLATLGSAVHGGGSCQISITKDNPPTKNTKWMVIHSIEGGCPAKGQAGNLAETATTTDTYQFKIPDGIKPDDYVLAWTWFNRIGNREMYMACAPFKVTGGKSKRGIEARKEQERAEKRQSSFPQMYTANICSGCSTVENQDYAFPDPGASVVKFPFSATSLQPAKKCSCFGGSSSGSSSGGSSGGSGAPSSPSPAPQTPSQPSPAPQAPAPQAPAPAPAAPAPVAAAPAGGCTPGGVVCSADGTKFGICTAAGSAVMQAVAAGTACRGGAITRA